ncbi:hypothetical protein IKF40_00850 [Candidatus Saccharibacteria bacterium]|nr:hypothetical protein [Candidatus Saccharibacteria bacterium]
MNMRKYRNLISKVFMVIFLASIFTGCGDDNATSDTVAAPKVEAIPETVEVENEAALEIEQSAETAEADVAEPGESEESLTLDESKYLVDGTTFYPREYARQLGYTLYESPNGVEEIFSICHYGIEYYVYTTWDTCTVSWTDGNNCYCVFINERLAPDFTPECKIVTAGVTEENSSYFLNAEMTAIEEVATGKNLDPISWDISGVSFAMDTFDCQPEYDDNGFIDTYSFKNVVNHFKRNYK